VTTTRNFHHRQVEADPRRIPPGQYATGGFPVLSSGVTPHTPLDQWTLTIGGAVEQPATWTWAEFRALPSEAVRVDIHCVTKWSKLDTTWTGVAIDTLLRGVDTRARHALISSDGGYTTHGRAWVVYEFEGEPLPGEHGGPARLLVPHLYFWKSAKWVRSIELRPYDEPGFWEMFGYHNYGDPWREQRYQGD
jgi:DMSO/TMAO reductase YedYZ molybdopterin-dependent catalytic subunit